MQRLRRFSSRPFGAALLGSLFVSISWWATAYAAGLVGENEPSLTTPAAPAASTAIAASRDGLSVNDIYEQASSGVAHIEARGVAAATQLPFGPPGSQQGTATGSGFVIDEQGHIVTNAHVVSGAEEIEVRLGANERTYKAELLGEDGSTDIAVLGIDASEQELTPLPLGASSELEVGDPVVAIGNPFGLNSTATAGIVSALQREISAPNGFTINDVIQTDAAINPGNSGGPLIGGSGEVVGVNSQIESPGGGSVGIGFAVPIATAREIAQQLIDDGSVEHAFLGLTGADLTPELAAATNSERDAGALVQSVVPGSPAAEAGLRSGEATLDLDGQRVRIGGDLIVAVGGEELRDMSEVIAEVDSRDPGETIELTVVRGGEERTIEVELGERPATVNG